MMYRGFSHRPVTPSCKACRGTGRIDVGVVTPYSCSDCNGTGIEGNPRLGLIVILISIVLTFGPLLWWLWPEGN